MLFLWVDINVTDWVKWAFDIVLFFAGPWINSKQNRIVWFCHYKMYFSYFNNMLFQSGKHFTSPLYCALETQLATVLERNMLLFLLEGKTNVNKSYFPELKLKCSSQQSYFLWGFQELSFSYAHTILSMLNAAQYIWATV